MTRGSTFGLAVLLMGGCSADTLSNGYKIQESGMNREGLQSPDGSMVVPGLMKSLYRRDDQLLLVAHAASSGGQLLPPIPIDHACLVALSVDTATGKTSQLTLTAANEMAEKMTEVFSTDRNC